MCPNIVMKDLRKWKRKMKPILKQLNFFQHDLAAEFLDDEYYKYLVNYYKSINDKWELVTL